MIVIKVSCIPAPYEETIEISNNEKRQNGFDVGELENTKHTYRQPKPS